MGAESANQHCFGSVSQLVEQLVADSANYLVIGGPGVGRSGALIDFLVEQLREPANQIDFDNVLILAQSRYKAQQIRSQIVEKMGQTWLGAKVYTPYSWAWRLVTTYAGDSEDLLPQLLTGPQQVSLLAELIRGDNAQIWPESLRQSLGSPDFVLQLQKFISTTRQLGLDEQDLKTASEKIGNEIWRAAADFFEQYLDVADQIPAMDYTEVVYRARLAVADPKTAADLASQIKLVVLDEFEDCDLGVIGLLQLMVGSGIRLVSFADPDQSIFSFRGAGARIVTDFEKLFANPMRPTRIAHLNRNVTYSKAVCSALTQIKQQLVASATMPIECGEQQDPGNFGVYLCKSESEQYRYLAKLINQIHLSGVAWDQIAVICRNGGAEKAKIVAGLNRFQIPASSDTPVGPMINQPGVGVLIQWLKTLLGFESLSEAEAQNCAQYPIEYLTYNQIKQLLSSPIIGADPGEIVKLHRVSQQENAGFIDCQNESSPQQNLLGHWLSQKTITNPVLKQLISYLTRLNELLLLMLSQVNSSGSMVEVLECLWKNSTWKNRLQAEALGEGSYAEQANRELDAICDLFYTANRSRMGSGYRALRIFIDNLENESFALDNKRESAVGTPSVTVATVHSAKASLWEVVMVVGLEEQHWPSLNNQHTVFRHDLLTSHISTGAVDPGELVGSTRREIMLEEHRMFYLACASAKKQLYLWANLAGQNGQNTPSRFLNIFSPIPANQLDAELKDDGQLFEPDRWKLEDFVAFLRNVICDEQYPAAAREGAAEILAELAEAKYQDRVAVAPWANPNNWWGIPVSVSPDRQDEVEQKYPYVTDQKLPYRTLSQNSESEKGSEPSQTPVVRLNGSAISSLLDCPRKWAFEKKYSAAKTAGYSAELGTVIHLCLEQLQTGNLDRSNVEGFLAEQLAELNLGNRYQLALDKAQSCVARFLAWEREKAGEYFGSEVSFSGELKLENATIAMSGVIDRVELDKNGDLVLVDFKTGKAPETKKALANDQIACYQLAVSSGLVSGLAGRKVSGAKLVYLAEPAGKKSILPKEFTQESIADQPWLAHDPYSSRLEPLNEQNWIGQHLANAALLVDRQDFYAVAGSYCRYCQFKDSCPAQGE